LNLMTMIHETNDQGVVLIFPKIIDNYRVLQTINHGSFSVVVLVENMKTGGKYACKVISRKILEEKETILHFEQETRLHGTLKHENICELIEIIFKEEYIYMILEYCSNGELFDYICKNGRANTDVVKKFFAQLVSALSYLHAKNIAHRDLKLENIYLDEQYNVKLGDFGFCHSSDEDTLLSTSCGSCFYVAPEIIKGEQYDGKKADIWSMGVILFVISTGSLPWVDNNQAKMFDQIEKADYKIPGFVPREIQEIIRMCLKVAPSERPDIETLATTPFIASYNDIAIRDALVNDSSSSTITNSFVGARKRPLIIWPVAQSYRRTIDIAQISKNGNTDSILSAKKKIRRQTVESSRGPDY
jgi:serine/threonine protein kinase